MNEFPNQERRRARVCFPILLIAVVGLSCYQYERAAKEELRAAEFNLKCGNLDMARLLADDILTKRKEARAELVLSEVDKELTPVWKFPVADGMHTVLGKKQSILNCNINPVASYVASKTFDAEALKLADHKNQKFRVYWLRRGEMLKSQDRQIDAILCFGRALIAV